MNGSWAPSTKMPGGLPSNPGAAGGKTAKIFTALGPVESQDTFGSTGKQVADPSALRLKDGRVRLISWVNPVGLRTATSTDASGTTFVADATVPLAVMGGQPRLVRIDASTVRLFYVSAGTISTALSADQGLTFADQGPVITTAQAGFEPGTLSVVKKGRLYRAYFSNLEKPGERAPRIMKTATSTDMIHWTVGPQLSIAGSHPFALIDARGKVALYYAADGAHGYGIYVSTSKDGITFGGTKYVVAGAGDPDIIMAGKSAWIMYYGAEVSPSTGFGVFAAKSIGDVIP
ncbi:MAG: hypothetical protein KGP12_10345 [Actinomycetales bacterium]|nr:hypothetical protein [Actinomycetales bacterium]